jgi:hypothetical protein
MKSIQPIDVWVDGEIKQATELSLLITYDNLESDAVFQYTLSDQENNGFVKGTLAITGSDYTTWGQSLDANSDAYNFAAAQLNLTLI